MPETLSLGEIVLKLRQSITSLVVSGALFSAPFCVIAASPVAQAESTQASPAGGPERNRLEELFIWKVSEELKLPPMDEQKFSELIRKLNARKRKATEEMEKVVRELAQAKTKSAAEKTLARHRALLNEYHAIQLAEVDQLKPLLGPERLARYLVVKSELTEKLKTLLSAPGAGASPAPATTAPATSAPTTSSHAPAVPPAASPSPKP